MVFAVSSVVLLLTTLWMMADDHNRPWKDYQRTFNQLDYQTAVWQAAQQESLDYTEKLNKLQQALNDAQGVFTDDDRKGVEEFLKQDEKFTKDFNERVKGSNVGFTVADDSACAKRFSRWRIGW